MHGDRLHVFLSLNHCKPLTESVARDALATVGAARDHDATHIASVCVRFVIDHLPAAAVSYSSLYVDAHPNLQLR